MNAPGKVLSKQSNFIVFLHISFRHQKYVDKRERESHAECRRIYYTAQESNPTYILCMIFFRTTVHAQDTTTYKRNISRLA